ncbi:spore germination lipoprotein GerD [Paenibacillus turpanensis]|uniref:spore germination lipoprotein GerD n=1 Tax=Paenibacillus turpanensis TaxID=2689078 RepID=UPI001409BF29|nr:spore germination lipoprotein GerD [Paenibacillus turpanensis]
MNVKRIRSTVVALTAVMLTAACGMDTGQQSGGQLDYKETKTMVLDILKTEDGEKAIKDAMKKGEGTDVGTLQILSTGQGQQLQLAVKEVITKPEYATTLKNMMIDPKFAADFAKATSKEQKTLMQDLMKDPQYQQALIDVMKNPEFERIVLDVMKTSQYRQQMQTVIRETLQNPLYKDDLMKLMEKALEEQAKPKPDEQKGQKQGGGGGESGGGGGGESGGGGGGESGGGGGGESGGGGGGESGGGGGGGGGESGGGGGGESGGGEEEKKKEES